MKKYLALFMLICCGVEGQTMLFPQNGVTLTFYKPTSTNTGGGGCYCGGNQFGYTFADYVGGDIELSCQYAIALSCFCSGTSINGTSGLYTSDVLSANPAILLSLKFDFNTTFYSQNGGGSRSATVSLGSYAGNAVISTSFLQSGAGSFALFANNTGTVQTYSAPDGTMASLPNESYEVWIGTAKTPSSTFTNAQGLLTGFGISSGAYGALGLKNIISNLTIQSLSSTTPPCPTTLTYQSPTDDFSTTPSPALKTASVGISAANKITGTATTVTYQAGGKVELTAGFKVDTGTVFKAQIGGCN